jgi:hypothetical protein
MTPPISHGLAIPGRQAIRAVGALSGLRHRSLRNSDHLTYLEEAWLRTLCDAINAISVTLIGATVGQS